MRVSRAYWKKRKKVPPAWKQALVHGYHGVDLEYAKRLAKKDAFNRIYGVDGRTIGEDCPLFTGATRECADIQSSNAQRLVIHGGERLQMAGFAGAFWQVVDHSSADEQMVEERSFGKSV